MPDALPAAVLAFSASADPAANAARIRAGLNQAAAAGARLLLTPECALVGYPGAGRSDFSSIDWCQVADEEEALARAARTTGMLLVVGSASPTSAGGGIFNEAVILDGNDPPRPLPRYRKRCLTPHDRSHFIPGPESGPLIHEFAGWKLALSICFEVRFGALWAEQAAAGADAFLNLAHMGGADPDPGTKPQILPNLYGARAAEWATPLLLANTAHPDRWLDSAHWDARGVLVERRGEGLLETRLRPRSDHDAWYAQLRTEGLARQTRAHRSFPGPSSHASA